MNENEAAQFLNLSVSTLQKRRFKGMPPEYSKIGKSVRYDKNDLIDFLSQNKISKKIKLYC